MILDFSINKKKLANIKNRKLNCSLHTKKTDNTNKLMQISYHLALTKITELKKKKSFFLYRSVRMVLIGTLEIGRYAQYMAGMPNI